MKKLSAHFEVTLPSPVFVSAPEHASMKYRCRINEFDVILELRIPSHSHKEKNGDDPYWTYPIETVYVKVTRQENEPLPRREKREKKTASREARQKYLKERLKDYGDAANEAINRFINFSKFTLRTPGLHEIPSRDVAFHNAVFTDETGKEVTSARTVIFESPYFAGMNGQLGVKKFISEITADVESALTKREPVQIYDEILLDGQAALFEGNLRRAVLDIAIACEILVKREFFSEDTPAGVAFDYLEDKSRLGISSVDYIDKIAKEAFGKSFREDFPKEHKSIDYLFRCRNKAVHRGRLGFRDDNGKWFTVKRELVSEWYMAVVNLAKWFSEIKK